MSACERFGPLLDGHHDGELGALDRWRVERHLTRCAGCRDELASLRGVGELVRSSLADAPDLDVWNAIAGRLPARPRTPVAPERRAPRIRRAWIPGAAAAATAAAAAVLYVNDPTETPQLRGPSGVVRSVYAPDAAVMVLEAEKSEDATIIWLMDPPPAKQEVTNRGGL